MSSISGGLQFDWLRAGLSMDLPSFIHSHTKTGLKCLLKQERCLCWLLIWLQVCQLQTTKIQAYRVLVLSGLESVKVC